MNGFSCQLPIKFRNPMEFYAQQNHNRVEWHWYGLWEMNVYIPLPFGGNWISQQRCSLENYLFSFSSSFPMRIDSIIILFWYSRHLFRKNFTWCNIWLSRLATWDMAHNKSYCFKWLCSYRRASIIYSRIFTSAHLVIGCEKNSIFVLEYEER